MELGVGDLMNSGTDRLYFAHVITDSNPLIIQGEEAIHIRRHGLNDERNRSASAQGFHEHIIVLHIPVKVGRKLRQRLALCLAHIEYGHGLKHGDTDFSFFLHHIPVCIQYGKFGIRVDLFLFALLFIGRRSNDLDAFFALHDISAELVMPFVETCHMGGVGALHIDQHGVVDAVLVKAAHGGKILPILVAFKQLLDAGLYAVGNVFEPRFILLGIALVFCHRLNTSLFL